ELLLRGAQTEGELRGRAARMEPIPDLAALRGVLDLLRAKRLVIDITPPGRGQIISHALYEPEELERLRARYSGVGSSAGFESEPRTAVRPQPSMGTPSASPESAGRLSEELRSVRAELAQLRSELEALSAMVRRGEEGRA